MCTNFLPISGSSGPLPFVTVCGDESSLITSISSLLLTVRETGYGSKTKSPYKSTPLNKLISRKPSLQSLIIQLKVRVPVLLLLTIYVEHFKSKEELDRWLKRILRNIGSVLHGVKPLVVWSGNGYHIIVPVKATEALEQFDDFESYTNEPSKEFLQFAEHILSLNKADHENNPSFKSCLLRVPYTFNSNCIEERIDAEVKIIQAWNIAPLPKIDNLLVEFQTFLVDKKLKAELKQEKNASDKLSHSNT